MEEEGSRLLQRGGVPPEEVSLRRYCEMRYVGQGHEIAVPLPDGPLERGHLEAIQESFDREYQRLYHRLNPGYRVECLSWRVVASGPRPRLQLRRAALQGTQVAAPKGGHPGGLLDAALKGGRPVYFPELGGYRDCPVYDRYRFHPGQTISGPAIMEERESTVIAGPGSTARVDEYLNLMITLGS